MAVRPNWSWPDRIMCFEVIEVWTSERNRNLNLREADAEIGVVTLGGDPAGVVLGGERRWLPVYGPGGYRWRPSGGDRVLVLKAGSEGELPCVIGVAQNGSDLQAGEVRLGQGEGMISMKDAAVCLLGEVQVNHVPLEEYIRKIVADMNSGLGG